MRKPLTRRQEEIYLFIVEEIRERGMPPTIREIGDRFGMRSSNGAREALNAIVRKGYIRRHDRLSRGIELVDPIPESSQRTNGRQVPIIEAFPDRESDLRHATVRRHLTVDSAFLPTDGEVFAVRIVDNLLADFGMQRGDYAVACAREPFSDECFVVTIIGYRPVVRRYRSRNGSVSAPIGNGDPHATLPCDLRYDARTIGEVCTLIRAMGRE